MKRAIPLESPLQKSGRRAADKGLTLRMRRRFAKIAAASRATKQSFAGSLNFLHLHLVRAFDFCHIQFRTALLSYLRIAEQPR
jgi:hypothetical protein